MELKSIEKFLEEKYGRVDDLDEVADNFIKINKGREGKFIIIDDKGTENKDRVLLELGQSGYSKFFDIKDSAIVLYSPSGKEHSHMKIKKSDLEIIKKYI